VVVFPTDTGTASAAGSITPAVRRIFELKGGDVTPCPCSSTPAQLEVRT
jgi:hypothetical protein